jgi:hypothetical protein
MLVTDSREKPEKEFCLKSLTRLYVGSLIEHFIQSRLAISLEPPSQIKKAPLVATSTSDLLPISGFAPCLDANSIRPPGHAPKV